MGSGIQYFYHQESLKNIIISDMEPLQRFEQGGGMFSDGSMIAGGVCARTGVLGWERQKGGYGKNLAKGCEGQEQESHNDNEEKRTLGGRISGFGN